MKIAFCNRPNYNSPLGGDAVQMLKTKEYLELLYGLNIEIITNEDYLNKSYDLIHVFNYATYQITERFINKALAIKIPIASSPIYWDYSYSTTLTFFKLFNLTRIDENTINFERKILKLLSLMTGRPDPLSNNFKKKIRFFIESSDIILPNSKEEFELLLSFSNIKKNVSNKAHIVYNACEIKKSFFLNEKDFFEKYKIPKGFVLQVGRIEYLKNQLNVLRSLEQNKEIPIVFVGKISQKDYFEKLEKIGKKRGNVYFMGEIKHEDLTSFYKYAAIHILPSLRESPGLVNLEALSQNCPIVISDKRFMPIETYFKNQKYVVNPLNISEIKKTILLAFKERSIGNFNKHDFSWQNAARQTYEGYKKIINIL